jgi:transposase
MRRCHLRGRENILKRQLAHVSAFNLSLIMRQLLGAGTPRELKIAPYGSFRAFLVAHRPESAQLRR